MSQHLIKNKYYWIALIITLITMVPTDRNRIVQYSLGILLCSTALFSCVDLDPQYIFKYSKCNKIQNCLIVLFSIVHAVVLSKSFYLMWLPSNKLAALASHFHLGNTQLLTIIIIIAFPCMVCSGVVLLSHILRQYQQSGHWTTEIGMIILFSFLSFQTVQGISCGLVSTSGLKFAVCGTLIVVAFICLVNVVTGSLKTSILLGTIPIMIFAIANYYVYEFRGREICPFDFLSIGTAMNVVGEYQFSFSQYVVLGWLEWVFLMVALFLTKREVESNKNSSRLHSGIMCLLSTLLVLFLAAKAPVRSWTKDGSSQNGTVLNFFLQLRDSNIKKPDNYSPETIRQLEQQYQTEKDISEDKKPTIIVIMDESFTDFSVLGNEVQTEEPLLPYLSTLEDNTIRGYVFSSVYGGNTANSEFEFLTGNSMAFLPSGCVPYQQYIFEEQYSLLSYLHSVGYYCVATHPYLASGWNRREAYKYLGFDEQSFISDYPQKDLVRKYVSDREMFEYIIQRYQDRDQNRGLFLFGITMQNHGGYTYTDFKSTVSLKYQKQYPEAEQFLSLANLSDQALEFLLSYFSNVQDPVVICFFGDHQPRVESGFLEAVHGGAFDDLDNYILKYKVPFFIWANYDIAEQNNVETSINYLSSHLLEVCGLDLPPYNRFLLDAEQKIPIVTSQGYYSRSRNCFLEVSAAEGEEKEILNQYNILEYCNMFDKKQDSPIFQYILLQ